MRDVDEKQRRDRHDCESHVEQQNAVHRQQLQQQRAQRRADDADKTVERLVDAGHAGKVLFGDEYVDVVTDGSFVEPGQQVRVIRVQGNRVVVRLIPDRGDEPTTA